MNKLFNYKLVRTTNLIKIGFPYELLNKVLKTLEDKNINYLIIDTDITFKYKIKTNQYIYVS